MRTARQALALALAKTSFSPRDMCMRSVLSDYGLIPTNVTLGHDYENAMEGWALSTQKRYDTNWPAGAPLYFRGPNGHVCLGLPNGMVRSTTPGSTGMITTTLQDIINRSGDPYLGYALDFAGQPIDFTETSGGGSTPFEEDDMQKDERDALFLIKQYMEEQDQWMGIIKSLGVVYKNVGDIRQFLTETEQWTGIIPLLGRVDANVTQLLAKVITAGGESVDASEVARELAPLLLPQIVSALDENVASDADVAKLRGDLLTAAASNQDFLAALVMRVPAETLESLGLALIKPVAS